MFFCACEGNKRLCGGKYVTVGVMHMRRPEHMTLTAQMRPSKPADSTDLFPELAIEVSQNGNEGEFVQTARNLETQTQT